MHKLTQSYAWQEIFTSDGKIKKILVRNSNASGSVMREGKHPIAGVSHAKKKTIICIARKNSWQEIVEGHSGSVMRGCMGI